MGQGQARGKRRREEIETKLRTLRSGGELVR